MKLYSAADLHSNNHFLTIIDEQDRRILEKRAVIQNDDTRAHRIISALADGCDSITGEKVEGSVLLRGDVTRALHIAARALGDPSKSAAAAREYLTTPASRGPNRQIASYWRRSMRANQ